MVRSRTSQQTMRNFLKSTTNSIILFIAPLILIVISQRTYSQELGEYNWPQFRGFNCSGVARNHEKPPVHLDTGKSLLWKSAVLTGESSPCIWEDRIFLTGFDREKKQLRVMCYNRLDGNLIWSNAVPAKKIETFHRSASPADATPVTDGRHVYVHFGSYGLLCYDYDGNEIWSHELPVNNDKFGTGTSPILADNLVILMVRRLSTRERYLLAMDKTDGTKVWTAPLLEAGYSTPIIWRDEVIIHCEGFVAGHSLEDGTRNWNILVRTHGESTPIVNGNMLYVNTWHFLGHYDFRKEIPAFEDFIKSYDTNQDSCIDRQEFSGELFMENEGASTTAAGKIWNWFDVNKDDMLDQLEIERYLNFFKAEDFGVLAIRPDEDEVISSDHVKWRAKENVAEVPSPLYFEGRIYVVKNGGVLSCVEASTGNLLYKDRIKGTGPYFASPVAVNGHIYIASHNGKFVVLKAGDKFRIISSFSFGEKILATPAIVDHKIYVRTSDHLYAFGD